MSLVDIASELELIDNLDDLWPAIVKSLNAEGFSHVIYLTVGSEGEAPVLLSTHESIHEGVDIAADPFLDYCCHSYAPTLTGAAYLPRYDYLPDAARDFIQRAARTGFRSGLAIPVRLVGSSRYGGFNIGTGDDAERFETRFTDMIPQLRSFCLLMHRRIEELQSSGQIYQNGFRRMRVSGPEQEPSPLTDREREVLFLLASGMSRKECARSCGISPHTVSDYTKSIYRKLGVRNVVEAAHAAQLL